jgi:hypothetical protein
MAQVVVTHEPGVVVEVIQGSPPADRSAEIAELESRVAQLAQQNAELSAVYAEAAAQRGIAEDALVELKKKVAALFAAFEGLRA